MWSKRMAAFLREKDQILWDVTVDTGYVQQMNFLVEGVDAKSAPCAKHTASQKELA
jgi:hypothetical protein